MVVGWLIAVNVNALKKNYAGWIQGVKSANGRTSKYYYYLIFSAPSRILPVKYISSTFEKSL